MSADHEELDRLAADYVRGVLDESEAREMEIRMLEDEALFARVQAEQLLHAGLRRADLRDPDPAGRVKPFRRWPAFAATGALALAVVVTGVHIHSLNEQIEASRLPAPGVSVITLFDERTLLPGAAEPETGRALPAGGVLVEIDVSAEDETVFELEIATAKGTRRLPAMAPDTRGYLTVYVPEAGGLVSISVLDKTGGRIKHFDFEN